MSFRVGDVVFFRHPQHSWVLGSVTALDSAPNSSSSGAVVLATCVPNDPARRLVGSNAPVTKLRPEIDVAHTIGGATIDEQPDDLLNLTVLHESTLLRCLFLRYMSDIIYTSVGNIVVALNPFTYSLPHYQDSEMPKYLSGVVDSSTGAVFAANNPNKALLPHVWACAHVTYHELMTTRQPQFILVSGESGSGKTESSKIVVKYLTAAATVKASSKQEQQQCATCGERLQQCSPILECFGNAKTVRNDNSSRFGKFMRIQFAPHGALLGSFTERYLLEKSRIITAAPGERIYHSFYMLFQRAAAGSSAQSNLASELLASVVKKSGKHAPVLSPDPRGGGGGPLLQAKQFVSLNRGGVLDNSDFNTAEDLAAVTKAMKTVGMSLEEMDAAWRVACGIVHLQNVTFVEREGGEGGCRVSDAAQHPLTIAAVLWGVDPDKLGEEMTQSSFSVRGETSVRRHSEVTAKDARDALCKSLYDSLFAQLVRQCNRLCDAGSTNATELLWIGLLDIFGFEDFTVNSFEQLCINFANETLQGHYNSFVFDNDMEECRAEGINTVDIPCPDSTPCLAMIGGPRESLFALLDDQSSMATGSNLAYVECCVQRHGGGASPDFVVERTKRDGFSVKHYAGTVTYDCNGWVEKNRDALKEGLITLLQSSVETTVIAKLLELPVVPVAGKKKTYVSTFFRQQMSQLMAVILESNPHWVRCIKPHPAKKPRLFDGLQAMQQLESSGVLGTVTIRKAGYPVRMLYALFAERFRLLSAKYRAAKTVAARLQLHATETACRAMVAEIAAAHDMTNPAWYQLGKTKAFLKAHALTKLEHARQDLVGLLAKVVQKAGRGMLSRKNTAVLRVQMAIRRIVEEYRAYLARTAEVRKQVAERQAALQAALRQGVSDLLRQFEEVLRVEGERLYAARTKALSECLARAETYHRELAEREEDASWTVLYLRMVFDFILDEESLARLRLQQHSQMAQERSYLLQYAIATLQDDLLEEEEYRRFRLEESAHPRVTLYRDRQGFCRVYRELLVAHLDDAFERCVAEWAEVGNATITQPFFAFRYQREIGEPEESGRMHIEEEHRTLCMLMKQFEVTKVLPSVQQHAAVALERRERDALVQWESDTRASMELQANTLWTKEFWRTSNEDCLALELEERDLIEQLEEHVFRRVSKGIAGKLWILSQQDYVVQAERRLRRSLHSCEYAAFQLLTQQGLQVVVTLPRVERSLIPIQMNNNKKKNLVANARDEASSSWLEEPLVVRPIVVPTVFAQAQDRMAMRELTRRQQLQEMEWSERGQLSRFATAMAKLWRRELHLRRTIFVLRCVQVAELHERLSVLLLECKVREGYVRLHSVVLRSIW